jgi:ribosomal protein L37AE/L43A
MIIFKEKTKKKCDHPINIDNKHTEILKLFEHQPQMVNDLKIKLTKYIDEYAYLSSIDNTVITNEQLERKFELKFQIDEMEKKIAHIEQQNNPIKYFVHTGHTLFQYYNKVNVVEQIQPIIENKNPLSKSILEFFKTNTISTHENEHVPEIETKTETVVKNLKTKTQMMDKYMSYVDSRYITDKNKEDDIEVCNTCNTQKLFIHAEGIMVCQKCGIQDYVLIDCDKPSYKEPPKEIAYFAYKRINHFKGWSGIVEDALLVMYMMCTYP